VSDNKSMLSARLATAAALLAACVTAMFVLPNGWWALALIPLLAAASWEWGALAGYGREARWIFGLVVLASAGLLWLGSGADPSGKSGEFGLDVAVYAIGCAFWLLVAPAWLALRWRVRGPYALGVAGWLVLVPAWFALAKMQMQPAQFLAVLGVVWLADTAAYFSGRAWGRHKLAPTISPGKTWEGVGGTAAAVAVYYGALYSAAPGWPWLGALAGAALFAGVTVMSVLGDLFESWIKRCAGVKDSGVLLPGHGGVMDRIDSLTASMPFAAILLLHLA